MSRRNILTILGAVLLAAICVLYYLLWPTETGTRADAATSPGYDVTPSDHTLGSPKAKVVLIEYGSPSCPVCAAFNAQSFGRLKATYIDTGKVYYVYRVYVRMPEDGAVEKIARCLPRDQYFAFVDLLFRSQSKWDPEYGVLDVHGALIRQGRIAGMSASQVERCIASTAEDDAINKVGADGEARYNVSATPTFVVDGVSRGAGNIPFETLAKFLDDELSRRR